MGAWQASREQGQRIIIYGALTASCINLEPSARRAIDLSAFTERAQLEIKKLTS
jgi:hypothetical protein